MFSSIKCQCDAAGERANAIFTVQLIDRGFTALCIYNQECSSGHSYSRRMNLEMCSLMVCLKEKVIQREKKICVIQENDGKEATGVCPVC